MIVNLNDVNIKVIDMALDNLLRTHGTKCVFGVGDVLKAISNPIENLNPPSEELSND